MIANPGVRNTSRSGAQRNYIHHMMSNMANNYERRRKQEASLDAADEIPPAPPLKVLMTDLYAKENAKAHFTQNYEIVNDIPSTPVFRRGFTFFLALKFDRSFEPPEDIMKFAVEFGPNPSITKGTKSIMQLTEKKQFTNEITKWDALINEQNDSTMTVEIRIPVTCQVGIWRFSIITMRAGDPSNSAEYKIEDDVYVLFNPWCKDDTVYLADDKERKEYVCNETGKLWMGSFRKPKGRRWVFGQFDDVVLPTCMYLLEISDIPHSERGNSVLMVRAISAVINSADEDGLIVGRWDGDYKDGTCPHAWTGSVSIMEQFLQNGGMPVKYGQCWVFSALVVTFCRALGIPCRSVTNYVSAHDTNASLTVDKYFDKEGNEIKGGPDGECFDSCWNFHVWNDVWMARPDLPNGYGGWQIIDATPQEESDSVYRCGPASREAVKQGKVGFLYDTPFVFAEVNADVCHFQEDDKSDWGFSRMRMNKYHVGRRIVTKRIDKDDDNGDADMVDVTEEYKNPEGSNEERLAVFNAVRGVSTAQKYYDFPDQHEEDVEFDLVEIDHIKFGQPFSIIVHLKNKSKEPRNIEAMLSASSVFYTGVTVHRLKKAHAMFKLQPNSKETLRVTVTAANYIDKLVDHSLIKIFAIANVRETRQTWSEEDDFPLVKPKMDVRVQGKVAVGQKFSVTFSFTNPLQRRLTNCTYQIEGPGLLRPKNGRLPKDVEPDDPVTINETFTPKLQGPRKIVVSFNSNELQEVMGSTTVIVQ